MVQVKRLTRYGEDDHEGEFHRLTGKRYHSSKLAADLSNFLYNPPLV